MSSTALESTTSTSTLVATVAANPPQSTSCQESETIQDTLKIHLVPSRRRKRAKGVQWSEDVVDNEMLGRKSSKKCCIFAKRQQFGVWYDSDTEDECECGKPADP
ncbi:hypothetical protein BSKO_11459 [Bryopsis sp. KO-2023]|nr:hypothetical protein BSKO_11459 [Bryopsis sp. KO-2023]